MRPLVVLFVFFFVSISFAQTDNPQSFATEGFDYSGKSLEVDRQSNDQKYGYNGLERRISVLERLVARIRKSNGCNNLKFFPEMRFPVMVLDDNTGYPGPVSSFSTSVPPHARCVELEVLVAIETDLPLVDTTTAGIMILNEVDGEFHPIGTIKVLGRAGYEDYENENTSSFTAPVIDGKVYYQFLNLFPPASDASTTTAVVVSVVGYYGRWG